MEFSPTAAFAVETVCRFIFKHFCYIVLTELNGVCPDEMCVCVCVCVCVCECARSGVRVCAFV